MTNMFERLMASPAAINRMAAMQLSHSHPGDGPVSRTTNEDLLRAQDEQYHALDTKLAGRSDLKQHAKLYDALTKLATLKSGTFYYKDYKRHVEKLWIAAHGNFGGKNYKVRLNDAIARAYKRYEAIAARGIAA